MRQPKLQVAVDLLKFDMRLDDSAHRSDDIVLTAGIAPFALTLPLIYSIGTPQQLQPMACFFSALRMQRMLLSEETQSKDCRLPDLAPFIGDVVFQYLWDPETVFLQMGLPEVLEQVVQEQEAVLYGCGSLPFYEQLA